jgi:L-alanine-DL-glutamate epimerase-like enolase superfamily enzyme
MRITWERVEAEAAEPFRISRSVQTIVDVIWVRIDADGIEGWGEADPSRYYGETSDTVVAALERMRPVIEAAEDPSDIERLEDDLHHAIGRNGSAHAAVSAALHDLLGKRVGEPLWRLWGLNPADAPISSFTIGLADPDEMGEKTRRASQYPILKIKVGTDRDREILAAVREAAPDAVIRVDANAAWSPRQAVSRIAMLADFGVEFVEQPLPASDREGYRYLRARSALPVIVDESCIVATDIPGLVGLADGINIKLAKCGGPREALRMIHTARACGLQVMMGCMLETSLGIAPAAHLAPLLDYADLDGAELLASDPFIGPHLDAGRIVLGEEPGLGITER